jgi:hypothetical protein
MNNNDPNLLNKTNNASLIDDLLANPFDGVQELRKYLPGRNQLNSSMSF